MTLDNCPPSETTALRQRVAELEGELREARTKVLEEAAQECLRSAATFDLIASGRRSQMEIASGHVADALDEVAGLIRALAEAGEEAEDG